MTLHVGKERQRKTEGVGAKEAGWKKKEGRRGVEEKEKEMEERGREKK